MNHSERWMEQGSRLARGTCTLRKMTQMESRRANPEYLKEGLVVRAMESVLRREQLFPFPAVQPSGSLVNVLVRVLQHHKGFTHEHRAPAVGSHCSVSLLVTYFCLQIFAPVGKSICDFSKNCTERFSTVLIALKFPNSNNNSSNNNNSNTEDPGPLKWFALHLTQLSSHTSQK